MLLRLTYVDIPIGFELDLHLEECKSTLKLVQILTEINYIDFVDIPRSFELDLHLEEYKSKLK